jgi:hypothetical protein
VNGVLDSIMRPRHLPEGEVAPDNGTARLKAKFAINFRQARRQALDLIDPTLLRVLQRPPRKAW